MKYFFYLRIYIHDKLHFLRLYLFEILFKINKKTSPLYDVLHGLRVDGFYILNDYYDLHEIKIIDSLLPEIFKEYEGFKNNSEYLERVPGSIKLKHIDKSFKLFKRFCSDSFLLAISFIFNFSIRKPSILISITHDGTLASDFIPGKCIKNIGHEPHIDSPLHFLKILAPISNVEAENGPTCIYKGTHRMKSFYKHFYSRYKTIGKMAGGVLSDEDFVRHCKNLKVKPIVLEEGAIAFVDTRCVHFASDLESGDRKIMWFYY